MADVFEVRIGPVLVRQEELNRQLGVSVREIPRLPEGVARYTDPVQAFTLMRWCMRQYPDQEFSLVGARQAHYRDVVDDEAVERELEEIEARQAKAQIAKDAPRETEPRVTKAYGGGGDAIYE